MKRALDHVADELARGEGGAGMTARVTQRVKGPVDVRDQHPLAIDDGPLHRARRQLDDLGHGHEAVEHAVPALAAL